MRPGRVPREESRTRGAIPHMHVRNTALRERRKVEAPATARSSVRSSAAGDALSCPQGAIELRTHPKTRSAGTGGCRSRSRARPLPNPANIREAHPSRLGPRRNGWARCSRLRAGPEHHAPPHRPDHGKASHRAHLLSLGLGLAAVLRDPWSAIPCPPETPRDETDTISMGVPFVAAGYDALAFESSTGGGWRHRAMRDATMRHRVLNGVRPRASPGFAFKSARRL
jgi:hypothetical protein